MAVSFIKATKMKCITFDHQRFVVMQHWNKVARRNQDQNQKEVD